jgi:hypothetical protein
MGGVRLLGLTTAALVTAPEPADPRAQHEHGTWVLGVLAAYAPGALVGGAYDADYLLAKVEEEALEYPAEEDLFVAGLEFVEAQGANDRRVARAPDNAPRPDPLFVGGYGIIDAWAAAGGSPAGTRSP